MSLTIPWYLRFGLDITIFMTPVLLASNYPRTIFTFQDRKKRLRRRKTWDEVKLRENAIMDATFVTEYKKQLQLK